MEWVERCRKDGTGAAGGAVDDGWMTASVANGAGGEDDVSFRLAAPRNRNITPIPHRGSQLKALIHYYSLNIHFSLIY